MPSSDSGCMCTLSWECDLSAHMSLRTAARDGVLSAFGIQENRTVTAAGSIRVWEGPRLSLDGDVAVQMPERSHCVRVKALGTHGDTPVGSRSHILEADQASYRERPRRELESHGPTSRHPIGVLRAGVRGCRVGKHLVKDLIVGVYVIANRTSRDGAGSEASQHDIDHIVAEAPAVGKAAGKAIGGMSA